MAEEAPENNLALAQAFSLFIKDLVFISFRSILDHFLLPLKYHFLPAPERTRGSSVE